MSCRVVSCRAVSCRVVSRHVMSCHVMSCRIVPCRVVSCHVVPCHVVSRHVASSRVVSCKCLVCRVSVSCRVVSCRIVSCRVVSCRVMSCHVMSCHATSRHVTSLQSLSSVRLFAFLQIFFSFPRQLQRDAHVHHTPHTSVTEATFKPEHSLRSQRVQDGRKPGQSGQDVDVLERRRLHRRKHSEKPQVGTSDVPQAQTRHRKGQLLVRSPLRDRRGPG